jgi:hypothetical protein
LESNKRKRLLTYVWLLSPLLKACHWFSSIHHALRNGKKSHLGPLSMKVGIEAWTSAQKGLAHGTAEHRHKIVPEAASRGFRSI